jgi:hypothetical protein
MRLDELKKTVDLFVKDGHGGNEVVVSVAEVGFGTAPYSPVVDVSIGIDWECGQVRITAKDPIIRKFKDRDKPSPKLCMKSFGDGMLPYICPECGMRVRKNDKYCSHCGQNIEGIADAGGNDDIREEK